MERRRKILTAIRRFFYLKESDSPDYMSPEEIAEIMSRPLTKEQEAGFPREFARDMAQILEEEKSIKQPA